MAVVFSNNAKTTLAATVSTSATSITVADGSVFPSISGSEYFYVTLQVSADGDLLEIVKVTARSGNTLTVIRSQDGTSARAFSLNDKCELRLTAAALNDAVLGGNTTEMSLNQFTGDGSTTAFTLSSAPDENLTNVFLSGVYQSKSNYSLSGATLTFSTAPPNGLALEIMVAEVVEFAVNVVADDSVTTDKLSNALSTKIAGIESGATADQTDAEIRTAIEAASDSNVFTDADHTKLDGIAASANNYVLPSGYATETYVNTQVTNLVDSSPAALDTLQELATALGNDVNFSTTVTNSIATKAALAGATFTGEITANGGIALGDNDKATFGASDDLKIHHNGSNSFIQDSGTGDLIIAGTNLSLRNYATDEIFLDGTSNAAVRVFYNGAPKLATKNTGIDVTGVVDVNTGSGTSPSYFNSFLNVQNNASTSSSSSLTITAGNAGYAGLHFGDAENGRIGQVAYSNADNALFFTANNTERMRILSDGAACFGTTTSRPAEFSHPDGFAIRFDTKGQFQNTVTNAPCGIINRDGTDGDILVFRKDGSGTPVGSIGTVASRLFIGNDDVFLTFQGSSDRIYPAFSSGGGRDNAIDLGAVGTRFKDLYLSGGVVFGTTGGSVSSKTLDDYEEGTWTPFLDASSSDPSLSYAVQVGAYEKIGALVHASFFMNVSAVNSQGSGTLRIAGLPFNASNNINASEVPAVMLQTEPFNAGDGAGYQQFARTAGNTNVLLMGYKTGNGGSSIPAGANNVGTGYLIGHIVYRTLA